MKGVLIQFLKQVSLPAAKIALLVVSWRAPKCLVWVKAVNAAILGRRVGNRKQNIEIEGMIEQKAPPVYPSLFLPSPEEPDFTGEVRTAQPFLNNTQPQALPCFMFPEDGNAFTCKCPAKSMFCSFFSVKSERLLSFVGGLQRCFGTYPDLDQACLAEASSFYLRCVYLIFLQWECWVHSPEQFWPDSGWVLVSLIAKPDFCCIVQDK